MFTFSQMSLERLAGVHPALVAVIHRALELTAVDFKVVEGVRGKEQAYINFGKGRTPAQCRAANCPPAYSLPGVPKVTWLTKPLESKHLIQADGYGHAVDLLPMPYDWKDLSHFDTLAKVVLGAASERGVKVVWGGTWKSPDRPHFELG